MVLSLLLDLMAVMIDGPVVIWKLIFRLVTHDQISLFQAHLHIRKEFLAQSQGFLEGFSGISPVDCSAL
jgi:hypothetical protein